MKIRRASRYLSSILRVAVVAGIFCLGLAQAQGPVPAFTLNSFGAVLTNDLHIGIEIQVTTPQVVTELGVIDVNSLGTLPANLFAGLTPSLVGLYQVNLQVPAGLADGTYKVEVSQSGAAGNATTLTVRQ